MQELLKDVGQLINNLNEIRVRVRSLVWQNKQKNKQIRTSLKSVVMLRMAALREWAGGGVVRKKNKGVW